MSTSSQNPPRELTRREQLIAILRHGGAMTDEIADLVTDKFAAENRVAVLNEAIEAARSEYLNDDTKTPEDEAYNQGVSDAIAAISALLEGGAL